MEVYVLYICMTMTESRPKDIETLILEKKAALEKIQKETKVLENTKEEMVITLNELVTASKKLGDEIRIQKKAKPTVNKPDNKVHLTTEEDKIIKKTFQGKSQEEATKIIKTNKEPKLGKILKKILIFMGITTLA
ncbi:MAG: hypothetical protein WCL18_05845 [bacterium]